jgi:hypothetical protein
MRRWISKHLADIGPNRGAHNERVKLIAGAINAAGVAAAIAGVVGPLFDTARRTSAADALLGLLFWGACLLAAFEVLGYIKAKD